MIVMEHKDIHILYRDLHRCSNSMGIMRLDEDSSTQKLITEVALINELVTPLLLPSARSVVLK